jgi:hypothetical protein
MFTESQIAGMEWQQQVSENTPRGEYRVSIEWVLDRFRIRVHRRVQEPEKLRAVRHAFYTRTAVKTANRLLRQYNRQETI